MSAEIRNLEFFGRIDENGNVEVFHESGEAATRMDHNIYAIGSDGSKSVRYEHPEGIVISRADAEKIGLEIDA
jgi:hypothetical protein